MSRHSRPDRCRWGVWVEFAPSPERLHVALRVCNQWGSAALLSEDLLEMLVVLTFPSVIWSLHGAQLTMPEPVLSINLVSLLLLWKEISRQERGNFIFWVFNVSTYISIIGFISTFFFLFRATQLFMCWKKWLHHWQDSKEELSCLQTSKMSSSWNEFRR